MKTSVRSAKLDKMGMTASLACAIHCAALPFVMTTLPLFGLGFLAHGWVEITMICVSLLLGIWSLSTSYPRHKRLIPLVLLVTGFAFIGSGHYLLHDFEAILIPLGGFTIAAAHFANWKYSKTCTH